MLELPPRRENEGKLFVGNLIRRLQLGGDELGETARARETVVEHDVAAGLIWRFMFDGGYGLSSLVTGALGFAPYYLLADKSWAFSAVLIVVLWKYFGF